MEPILSNIKRRLTEAQWHIGMSSDSYTWSALDWDSSPGKGENNSFCIKRSIYTCLPCTKIAPSLSHSSVPAPTVLEVHLS